MVGEPEKRALFGRMLGGKYRLGRLLGAGGMGMVVEAEHVGLERRVAVKLIRPGRALTARELERFHLEARTAAKVAGDGVVQILDIDYDAELGPYHVLELLEGESLRDRLGRGPLATAETLKLGIDLLETLERVHATGIVHRDIKPGNVFLTARQIKVLDFGIAFVRDRGALREALTAPGATPGTPGYMAPEQLQGERVDRRADLYAVAHVLYACFTGRAAHEGLSTPEVITRTLAGSAPPLRRDRPGLPEIVYQAFDRATARDPEQRHASAAEFASDLRIALSELGRSGVPKTPPSGVRRPSSPDPASEERMRPSATPIAGTFAEQPSSVSPPAASTFVSGIDAPSPVGGFGAASPAAPAASTFVSGVDAPSPAPRSLVPGPLPGGPTGVIMGAPQHAYPHAEAGSGSSPGAHAASGAPGWALAHGSQAPGTRGSAYASQPGVTAYSSQPGVGPAPARGAHSSQPGTVPLAPHLSQPRTTPHRSGAKARAWLRPIAGGFVVLLLFASGAAGGLVALRAMTGRWLWEAIEGATRPPPIATAPDAGRDSPDAGPPADPVLDAARALVEEGRTALAERRFEDAIGSFEGVRARMDLRSDGAAAYQRAAAAIGLGDTYRARMIATSLPAEPYPRCAGPHDEDYSRALNAYTLAASEQASRELVGCAFVGSARTFEDRYRTCPGISFGDERPYCESALTYYEFARDGECADDAAEGRARMQERLRQLGR